MGFRGIAAETFLSKNLLGAAVRHVITGEMASLALSDTTLGSNLGLLVYTLHSQGESTCRKTGSSKAGIYNTALMSMMTQFQKQQKDDRCSNGSLRAQEGTQLATLLGQCK